jgi:probable rRNA maturation factor
MSIDLVIQKQQDFPNLPSDGDLKHFVNSACLNNSETEVTLRIVDEAESQALNFQYRKKNKPTNVLAFPYETSEYLGDLVVCAPIVEAEASEQGKKLIAHWAHLLIHGILHLQDYDHVEEQERRKMEAMEIKLLKQLGYENPYDDE